MADIPDRRRIDDGRYADDRRGGRERRSGPDVLRRLLPFISASSWACVVLAFFVLSLAKPGTETLAGLFSDQPVSSGWNMMLLNYVFWLLFSSLILALGGFILNLMRRKRKGDNLYTSLIIASLFAVAFLVWLIKL